MWDILQIGASCQRLTLCEWQAVRAWTENSEYGRTSLVQQYYQCVEGEVLSCLGLGSALLC